ncbi:MAG: beta-ketoacyl-ACP synthase II [Chloroflexi bacterium]|nr:beta-ketoacyl-ACP synthase II [Chloroflexota bacterium]MCL5074852.1 beta-ketoacyl-ACP synthase II [Chloroflexota bacterium]
MRPYHRVVVTGLGAITPLGLNVEEYWYGLRRGISGVGLVTHFDASAYPTHIAAEVKDFDPQRWLEPREARRMSRFIHFAVAATQMALESGHFEINASNAPDVGVVIGTGIGSLNTMEQEYRVLLERGGMRINPFFLPMMLANMGAGQISRIFGAKGYNSTVVTACASSAQAIGDAVEAIRRGAAEVVIAGGSEASLCELGFASFCVIRALSTRNDEPTKASRPFDLHRDGFVPAEGAGVLLLERLEHALERRAPILAEIVGYASSLDAYHVVAPEPEGQGAVQVMQRALADARLEPTDVDYINAHGTSTQLNDAAETLAIKKVFGEYAYRLPISSTKSMIGHTIGAAGALEAIACILTIRDGFIHPTINYETLDEKCDLDYVPNVGRPAEVKVALSNSFAFGGHNACLIFRRYEG